MPDLEAIRARHDDFVTLYAGPVEAMTSPLTAAGAVLSAAAASAADVPPLLTALSEVEQGRGYWRREAAQTHEFWTDLGNEVLKNAPEEYDDDCAADAIAVRYVRDLEARVAAMEPVVKAVAGWMTGGTEAEIYAQKEALAEAWDAYETRENTE